jgi:hypothetical protein
MNNSLVSVIDNYTPPLVPGARSKGKFAITKELPGDLSPEQALMRLYTNRGPSTCSFCYNDTITIIESGFECSICKRQLTELVYTAPNSNNIYKYQRPEFDPSVLIPSAFYKLLPTKVLTITVPDTREDIDTSMSVNVLLKADIVLLLSKFGKSDTAGILGYMFPNEDAYIPEDIPEEIPEEIPEVILGPGFYIQNIIGNNGLNIDSNECKQSDTINQITVLQTPNTVENYRYLEYISITLLKTLFGTGSVLLPDICMYCFNKTLSPVLSEDYTDIVK